MRREIEHAVREQLALLNGEKTTEDQFARAIIQLAGTSRERQWVVREILAKLRMAGLISDALVARIAPLALVVPTHDPNGATVDLHRLLDSSDPPAPEAESQIVVGHVLRDRYVILEKLGTGGKGTVFKARDRYRTSLPEAQQLVALKVLHAGGSNLEQTVRNLQRELHCCQLLSHRNIVNVFELDRDGDIVFFTMEILDGELLNRVMQRMRPAAMQRPQAWEIIRQLGAGVAHAHERGIVHGDLKPGNVLVTREGEIRILDFGAAQKFVRTHANPDQPDFAPVSGTPAYASCELLEGRDADPRDDVYALACICYELLAGMHPFACRPATLARNFGVRANRPANLTNRQWKTLRTGLSWHRAARSASVGSWIRNLTQDIAAEPSFTPLHELKPTTPAKPLWQSRAAAAFLGVVLTAGAGIAELRETAVPKVAAAVSTRTAPNAAAPAAAAAASGDIAPRADTAPTEAATTEAHVPATKALAKPPPLVISIDGYHVSAGDRFVEIRVHRNRIQKNSSFAWWTEQATAKQDVDYVSQAKALQTFPTDGRSTRFYVKLLPESGRSQRNYFYVAIALPGHDRRSDTVTRAQIWLPTPRDQLQARQ